LLTETQFLDIGMERWLKNPFPLLDQNEMSQTINYGLDLLNRLFEQFEKNEKIRAIVRQKLQELEKNQKVLEHVVILKEDCFKERHWNQLFDHMKENDKNAITM
jgi:predicted thioredoxin/glutaredoxin